MSELRFEYWGHPKRMPTKNWYGVFLKDENATKLGEILWLSKAKSYCFCPKDDCGYGPQCLEEILTFLKSQMLEYKKIQSRNRKQIENQTRKTSI